MRSREQIDAEIADLKRKLAVRLGKPGFAANVEEIRVRIVQCRDETASG